MVDRDYSVNEANLKNLMSKVNFCLVLLFFTAFICNAQGTKTYEWGGGAPVTVPVFNPSSSSSSSTPNNSSSTSNNNNSRSSSRSNSSNSNYKSKEQIKIEQRERDEKIAEEKSSAIMWEKIQEKNRLEEERQKQIEAFSPEKQDLLANMKRPSSLEFVPVLNKDMQATISNQPQDVRTSGYPYNSIEEWFNALKRNLADFVSPETNEIELFLTNHNMNWDEFYSKYKDKLQDIFQGKTKDEIYEKVMSFSLLNKMKKQVDIMHDEIPLNKKTITNTQNLASQAVDVLTDPHATQTKNNELIEKANENTKKSAKDYQDLVKKNL